MNGECNCSFLRSRLTSNSDATVDGKVMINEHIKLNNSHHTAIHSHYVDVIIVYRIQIEHFHVGNRRTQ